MTILLLAAMLGAGKRLSDWLWHGRTSQPLGWAERTTSAALLGVALWLAANWLLSPLHALTRPALLLAGILAAIVAIFWRPPRPAMSLPPWKDLVLGALALAPLGAVLFYLLWRGFLAPVTSADAFIYHMPRAVLIAENGGYAQFAPVTDVRINTFAANYEMLLADFVILDRSDALSEWPSTLFYGLMLVAAAAAARRWWRCGAAATIAVVLLVAAVPLLLLHGAAYKNDVMTNYFFFAALLWAGRWLTTGERPAAILAIVAACASVGTKNHALLFCAVVTAAVLIAMIAARRRMTLRDFALYLGVAIVGFLLLGGQHYLGTFFYARGEYYAGIEGVVRPAPYGDWRNAWEGPILTFLVPFSPDPVSIFVPWTGQTRYWISNDVYASHYGKTVSWLVLLLPIVIWRYRRAPADASVIERLLILIAGCAFFIAVFPVRTEIGGFIASFPRYALLFPVLVICWVAAPLLAELERAPGTGLRAAAAAVLGAAWILGQNAGDFLANDKWAPASYLAECFRHPGMRAAPVMSDRAELVVDLLAGPHDAIDVHGGRDAWLYPVYGASFQRDVKLVFDAREIRPNAQWVVVDRAFNILWVHPKLKRIEDWRQYLGGGQATAEDTAVFKALVSDPHFALVFRDERLNQAVFRRVNRR